MPSHDLDRLYRQHAGSVTAALARHLGPGMLELIDAAVQEAFLRAAQHWPATGVPDSPVGWLIMTARNSAIDQIRQRKQAYAKAEAVAQGWRAEAESAQAPQAYFHDEVADDELRMMFVCCDPCLAVEAQVMLGLRTLCGFPTADIAAAFDTSDEAVAKRLSRARSKLRQRGVRLDLSGADLRDRLAGVLAMLYALFTEGYASHLEARPLRLELCADAIRLAGLLADHRETEDPRCHALLALMLLQRARMPARTDPDGALLTLEEQDRGRWDRSVLAAGLKRLKHAATGDRLHRYHIEAGIAACHAAAPNFAVTDWSVIADLYDQLMAVAPSPVVAINRAVAKGLALGTGLGLSRLHDLAKDPAHRGYLLDAAFAELFERQGHLDKAVDRFRKSVIQAPPGAARLGLERRLERLLPRLSA